MDENGQFPFKEVWMYMGYSRHSSAKRALYQGFKEGIDFIAVHINVHGQDGKMQRTADGKFAEENI